MNSADSAVPSCDAGNDYDGRLGLRISSIFVILVGSIMGALFPLLAKRYKGAGVPDYVFFIAKYFGSGVIIATAFIHLLAPAHDALTNPCLTGPITEYSWVEGIVLMTIFSLFFVELLAMRYATFDGHGHEHIDSNAALKEVRREPSSAPGEDHLGHAREHRDIDAEHGGDTEHTIIGESYASQLTSLFILEFGVIFHSIFIGLTLAVSGKEFTTLYVVLTFHQTFEGLGLGARLALTPFPQSKKWTPWLMGLAYGVATPIAIAIGLGVRKTYPPGSQTTLLVNGVFDSISAGILIYTGLVELMAHEFLFSPQLRQAKSATKLYVAFGTMILGAGLMAILGKWA